jgi:hypothetical protein
VSGTWPTAGRVVAAGPEYLGTPKARTSNGRLVRAKDATVSADSALSSFLLEACPLTRVSRANEGSWYPWLLRTEYPLSRANIPVYRDQYRVGREKGVCQVLLFIVMPKNPRKEVLSSIQ